jgi:CRP/FNR family transcriptional regulator, cyclic AMP receptor protein
MKNYHFTKSKVAFKDRTNLLLSNQARFPDFREKNIPYLSNIPEEAIANLMGRTKTLRYLRKATINSEFNKPDTFVIIFSGNATVLSLYDVTCKGTMIQVQEPKSGLGKIALFTDELISVSAVTLEKTVFAVILKNDFIDWLMNYPQAEFTLLAVLNEKLAV